MKLRRSMFGIMSAALLPVLCTAGVNVRSKSSAIHIDSGSTLIIDNPITNFTGRIVKQSGGTISGQTISFDEGVLENEGNKIRLTGDLLPGQVLKIVLNGSKTFRGKRGEVLENIEIRNKGNLIEGELLLKNPIVLHDATTTVSLALVGRLSQNITLNGGKIILEDDLFFINDKLITGSGSIDLNGRKLSFGAKELTWNGAIYFIDAFNDFNANLTLNATWTFAGNSVLCGNGNTLTMGSKGNILVRPNSSLIIKSTTIQNVYGNNIRCEDASSTITLQNVKWIQSADYSFTVGRIDILDKCDLFGTATLAYQSSKPITIKKNARLLLNDGMTFSYDAAGGDGTFIFEDASSILVLKGASFHVTATGLQFKKGRIRIKKESVFSSDTASDITLGDNLTTVADDCSLEITDGSLLTITKGLNIKNLSATACKMRDASSVLKIGTGATLKLFEEIDIGEGVVKFEDGSTLSRKNGIAFTGGISAEGSITYERFV